MSPAKKELSLSSNKQRTAEDSKVFIEKSNEFHRIGIVLSTFSCTKKGLIACTAVHLFLSRK